ncbi:hypothetical protein BLNAU_15893 [Blattamonas nauphoetae]|uniref:Uncharacterized protein n=1 Tax=Blattamonas nauphoetae TaxID=2049346 RepID=A0ABQ9XEX6_9EUKA|nr:hypothetical protein BLNAU_15893 [Blattamonas nauphoetae]
MLHRTRIEETHWSKNQFPERMTSTRAHLLKLEENMDSSIARLKHEEEIAQSTSSRNPSVISNILHSKRAELLNAFRTELISMLSLQSNTYARLFDKLLPEYNKISQENHIFHTELAEIENKMKKESLEKDEQLRTMDAETNRLVALAKVLFVPTKQSRVQSRSFPPTEDVSPNLASQAHESPIDPSDFIVNDQGDSGVRIQTLQKDIAAAELSVLDWRRKFEESDAKLLDLVRKNDKLIKSLVSIRMDLETALRDKIRIEVEMNEMVKTKANLERMMVDREGELESDVEEEVMRRLAEVEEQRLSKQNTRAMNTDTGDYAMMQIERWAKSNMTMKMEEEEKLSQFLQKKVKELQETLDTEQQYNYKLGIEWKSKEGEYEQTQKQNQQLIQKLDAKVEELNAALKKARKDGSELLSKKEALEDMLAKQQQKGREFDKETEKKNTEIEKLKKEIDKLKDQNEAMQKAENEREKEGNNEVENLSDDMGELRSELVREKQHGIKLEQEVRALTKEIEELRKEMAEANEKKLEQMLAKEKLENEKENLLEKMAADERRRDEKIEREKKQMASAEEAKERNRKRKEERKTEEDVEVRSSTHKSQRSSKHQPTKEKRNSLRTSVASQNAAVVLDSNKQSVTSPTLDTHSPSPTQDTHPEADLRERTFSIRTSIDSRSIVSEEPNTFEEDAEDKEYIEMGVDTSDFEEYYIQTHPPSSDSFILTEYSGNPSSNSNKQAMSTPHQELTINTSVYADGYTQTSPLSREPDRLDHPSSSKRSPPNPWSPVPGRTNSPLRRSSILDYSNATKLVEESPTLVTVPISPKSDLMRQSSMETSEQEITGSDGDRREGYKSSPPQGQTVSRDGQDTLKQGHSPAQTDSSGSPDFKTSPPHPSRHVPPSIHVTPPPSSPHPSPSSLHQPQVNLPHSSPEPYPSASPQPSRHRIHSPKRQNIPKLHSPCQLRTSFQGDENLPDDGGVEVSQEKSKTDKRVDVMVWTPTAMDVAFFTDSSRDSDSEKKGSSENVISTAEELPSPVVVVNQEINTILSIPINSVKEESEYFLRKIDEWMALVRSTHHTPPTIHKPSYKKSTSISPLQPPKSPHSPKQARKSLVSQLNVAKLKRASLKPQPNEEEPKKKEEWETIVIKQVPVGEKGKDKDKEGQGHSKDKQMSPPVSKRSTKTALNDDSDSDSSEARPEPPTQAEITTQTDDVLGEMVSAVFTTRSLLDVFETQHVIPSLPVGSPTSQSTRKRGEKPQFSKNSSQDNNTAETLRQIVANRTSLASDAQQMFSLQVLVLDCFDRIRQLEKLVNGTDESFRSMASHPVQSAALSFSQTISISSDPTSFHCLHTTKQIEELPISAAFTDSSFSALFPPFSSLITVDTSQQPKSVFWLLRIIRILFANKHSSDLSQPTPTPAQHFPHFVRKWLNQTYGLSSLVSELGSSLLVSAETHSTHNPDAAIYSSFLSCQYLHPHCSFYLFVSVLVSGLAESSSVVDWHPIKSAGPSDEASRQTGSSLTRLRASYLPTSVAIELMSALFYFVSEGEWNEIVERVRREGHHCTDRLVERGVRVDFRSTTQQTKQQPPHDSNKTLSTTTRSRKSKSTNAPARTKKTFRLKVLAEDQNGESERDEYDEGRGEVGYVSNVVSREEAPEPMPALSERTGERVSEEEIHTFVNQNGKENAEITGEMDRINLSLDMPQQATHNTQSPSTHPTPHESSTPMGEEQPDTVLQQSDTNAHLADRWINDTSGTQREDVIGVGTLQGLIMTEFSKCVSIFTAGVRTVCEAVLSNRKKDSQPSDDTPASTHLTRTEVETVACLCCPSLRFNNKPDWDAFYLTLSHLQSQLPNSSKPSKSGDGLIFDVDAVVAISVVYEWMNTNVYGQTLQFGEEGDVVDVTSCAERFLGVLLSSFQTPNLPRKTKPNEPHISSDTTSSSPHSKPLFIFLSQQDPSSISPTRLSHIQSLSSLLSLFSSSRTIARSMIESHQRNRENLPKPQGRTKGSPGVIVKHSGRGLTITALNSTIGSVLS